MERPNFCKNFGKTRQPVKADTTASAQEVELHVVDPFVADYDLADATSRKYVKLLQKLSANTSSFSAAYAQAMPSAAAALL